MIDRRMQGRVAEKAAGVERPRSLDELQTVLESSASRGSSLHVAGSRHSCSGLADPSSDTVVISLEDYVEAPVRVDPERRTVTAHGGVTLGALVERLAEDGMALDNLPSTIDVTIAGAIATGTHGSGVHGALDQSVVGMRLVRADGGLVEVGQVSPSRPSDHVPLDACRVSLGALGVVESVTLRCAAAYGVAGQSAVCGFHEALGQLESNRDAEYFRMWWFPDTDVAELWTGRRVELLPPSTRHGALHALWRIEALAANRIYETALFVGARTPLGRRRANVLSARLRRPRRTSVTPPELGLTLPLTITQNVMEYALPAEEAVGALTELRTLLRRRDISLHAPVEVRFVPENDAWLSMAYGRQTVYIGVIKYEPFGRAVPFDDDFRVVEETLVARNGRPHWAKHHFVGSQDLRASYPRFDDFAHVRHGLDPDGRFLTPYLAGLFDAASPRGV